jgi:hypothetical protein
MLKKITLPKVRCTGRIAPLPMESRIYVLLMNVWDNGTKEMAPKVMGGMSKIDRLLI